jgi:hypothetical protein
MMSFTERKKITAAPAMKFPLESLGVFSLGFHATVNTERRDGSAHPGG